MSKIEWTDATWNPVSGCTRVSKGCDFCYAVAMTKQQERFGRAKYAGLVNPGKTHFNGIVKLHPEELVKPLGWKTPRRIFVNSMSDLFHEKVPAEFIKRVFGAMREAHWHEFQVLTKRAERLTELDSQIDWPSNALIGVSVEDTYVFDRVDALRRISAKTKFLSCEPLLGPLDRLDLTGIDWVIVGGESGREARPMDPAWARALRDRSLEAGVPFFFKQWGAYDEHGRRVGKKRAGRLLDGRTWDEHPHT